MKKFFLKIAALIFGITVLLAPAAPAFAADSTEPNCVQTALFGEQCDDGEGSSIKYILNLAVSIMTIAMGVLAVIGISIVGIQYLTAGGNEEQTRKAKRRMYEIVLGLAAYAAIYALLYWLIPGFHPFGSGS